LRTLPIFWLGETVELGYPAIVEAIDGLFSKITSGAELTLSRRFCFLQLLSWPRFPGRTLSEIRERALLDLRYPGMIADAIRDDQRDHRSN
jgi:hypothetical protein